MKRTGFSGKRKPMKRVSDKRKAFRASNEGQEALAYMAAVKRLPCAVCGAPGPSIAHHCFHGRYGSRKASDFDVIPLCSEHHDYPHPEAIHSGKERWAAKHGPDYGFIRATRERLSAAGLWDFVGTTMA